MKLTINKKNENPLLGRLEVSGSLEFESATPSNADVAASLAAQLKINVKNVVVKNIYNKYSERSADFLAYVYNSVESKQKTEVVTKHMKKQAEAVAKKAAEEAKQAKDTAEKTKTEAQKAKIEAEAAKEAENKPAEASE